MLKSIFFVLDDFQLFHFHCHSIFRMSTLAQMQSQPSGDEDSQNSFLVIVLENSHGMCKYWTSVGKRFYSSINDRSTNLAVSYLLVPLWLLHSSIFQTLERLSNRKFRIFDHLYGLLSHQNNSYVIVHRVPCEKFILLIEKAELLNYTQSSVVWCPTVL